jgi:hypothetical protein
VLFRLGYLTASNVFAMLRLLAMDDRYKDVEILALRHQIAVLERQLGQQKVRFTPGDRAFLAALLHRLPTHGLRRLRLVVRPDTVLRSPRPDRPPPRRRVPAQAHWTAADGTFDPGSGGTPGQGEPQLGVPARAR